MSARSNCAVFAGSHDRIKGLTARRRAFVQIDADRGTSPEKGRINLAYLSDDLPPAILGDDGALLIHERCHYEDFTIGANL